MPIGTFAAPIFAGICLLPIAMDIGTRWALLSYLAVCIFAVLFVPDIELVLFFIVLLGYYPILQPKLLPRKHKVLQMALKLALFNLALAAVYGLLLFVLVSPALSAELRSTSLPLTLFLVAGGNITFVLYDNLLDKIRIIYIYRVRKHLFR